VIEKRRSFGIETGKKKEKKGSEMESAKPPKVEQWKEERSINQQWTREVKHKKQKVELDTTRQQEKIFDSKVKVKNQDLRVVREGTKWAERKRRCAKWLLERKHQKPENKNLFTHLILRPSPSSIILCVILNESAKELAACGIPNIPVPAWCCRCLYWDGDCELDCECECEGPAVCWKDEDWALESLAFWDAVIKV
jgi:hypothetical protein